METVPSKANVHTTKEDGKTAASATVFITENQWPIQVNVFKYTIKQAEHIFIHANFSKILVTVFSHIAVNVYEYTENHREAYFLFGQSIFNNELIRL